MNRNSWHDKDELIRKLLREFRVNASLTQVEVAQKLNSRFRPIHQSFVSKYESGERTLSLPEIELICHELGVELSDFIAEYQKRGNKL